MSSRVSLVADGLEPEWGEALHGVDGVGEASVQALIRHTPVGVFVSDGRGWCVYANEAMCGLTGLSVGQQLGLGWREALHPDDRDAVEGAWAEAAWEGSDYQMHPHRFLRPDGSVVWVETSAAAVRDGEGRMVGLAGVCIDVSERRLSEERYRHLFENARDAVYTADAMGRFTQVNRAMEELSGYSREQLLSMTFFDLIAAEEVPRIQGLLMRSLAGEGEESVEVSLVSRDGRRLFVEAAYQAVEQDGQVVGFEGIARDTTERHCLQEQLTYQAFHDSLTGLPNRALLLDRLGQALARTERSEGRVAVLLLDLDNFKLVNDSLGHAVGDVLLGAIASRLADVVRGSDTAARLGGDEFAIVVDSIEKERDLVTFAHRIGAAFETPFSLAGASPQRISASIGIALGVTGGDPEEILRNADTAMYAAKANPKVQFEFFDEQMRSRLLREYELETALEQALKEDTLQLHYQPIVALATGQTLALEALIRWPHPHWGWVQPSEFIPIAEADGLIIPLGRYVLDQAARQTAHWKEHYPDALPLGVFVNVSARQLETPGFAGLIEHTLHTHHLNPQQLGIEITERVFTDRTDTTVTENLARIATIGTPISLDDFGTGYSSLASLREFPFTALKIDRSFTHTIHTPTDPAPISTSIISLGKALGLTVIAEGIETHTQAHRLHTLGCHAAQGFHYAHPQPAADLAPLLEACHPRPHPPQQRPDTPKTRQPAPPSTPSRENRSRPAPDATEHTR